MHCIVTAGPTFEPLDKVRRLTNSSTGRLGSELANFLAARGHEVLLLLGQAATFHGQRQGQKVETFTTTADLRARLRARSSEPIEAVFHAAAVSDFAFGKILARSKAGELQEVHSGKIPTRAGTLLAELVPTPKIIAGLRDWFPTAQLVGWKYEVEGGRDGVVGLAAKQVRDCRTDACVANGPAYGPGFGLVSRDEECMDLAGAAALFEALERFVLA